MKRTVTLMLMLVALAGNILAWQPVIKERHWFGLKEFESELYPSPGVGPTQSSVNVNGNGELTSITLHRDWSNGPTAASSFNCWTDDSGNAPKPRFRFNASYNWEVGMNNNSNFTGYGLKVKDLGNAGGTIIHIQHLNNGDKLVFETYCVPGSDNIMYMPFLEEGSIEGVPALNYATEWSWDGASNIGNPDGVSREYLYTGSDDGTVSIKFPSNAVIRCITIIYNDDNYQKATTRVDPIRDAQNNLGYEMTITGAGVLEDKRGAVPYLTMRYGDMNDMTFSKYLGTVNGEKQYGTFSIVDETAPLNPSSVELQSPYRQRSEAQNQKSLVGKEITVFTENENLSDQSPAPGQESPRFNSIYPLYGNYFYFFPEVDGKFHVKFYCEGEAEMMCMWYKLDGDGVPVPIAQQNSSNLMMSTDGGNSWTGPLFGGGNSTMNQNYYEYTADFKKGGVYYLCSNPTIQTQQSPIPRLISYSFIPSFRIDPLYNVVDNGTTACTNMAQVYGGVFPDLDGNVPLDNIIINGESAPRVKCLGNVASAQPYFYTEGGVQRLGFRNITYKYKDGDDTSKPINKGGAIVVNVRCKAGQATFVLTIAYKAEEAEWAIDDNGNKTERKAAASATGFVKRWDFFSGKGDNGDDWDLGKYYNNYNTTSQSENTSSKLYKETHKADGLTADWVNTYVNLQDQEEPIFKSVYDMEGDNADMIHETAGLLFHTESNLLGIFNENAAPSSGTFQDRYIGLMGPSDLPLDNGDEQHARALTIPRLAAGDRIAIKMGCYGNVPGDEIDTQTAILKITGAQDAVGTAITGDYKIGGSGVETNNSTDSNEALDKSQPWGEYHFISTGGDFTLEVKEAELLKIYSIVIYRNANDNNASILTENELLGDAGKRQILYTQESTTDESVKMHIHYRGLDESPTYSDGVTRQTGNIQTSDVDVDDETVNGILYNTYTVERPASPSAAKFGVFSARMGVYDISGNKYVTDYVDGMIPVGYRETKTYPYTWDLTDLKKYVGAGIKTTSGDDEGNELTVTNTDLQIWNDYGLRVTPTQYAGSIFVSGGQLYGGTTMFEETRGIGIIHDDGNKVMTMTGTTTDESGALAVNYDGEIGFVIPQVAAGQAIYVRFTPASPSGVSVDTNGQNYQSASVNADGGDKIIAVLMDDDAETTDVKLKFSGCDVKKIAVSDEFKQLSSNGWATESRNQVIDPELTSYMTGVPFENLIVTSVDYTTKTVGYEVVNAVSAGDLMPACTADGGKQTYILHNTDNEAVEILNDGFHLFVPDMHDYSVTTSGGTTTVGGLKTLKDMSSVVMKAQLSEGTVARDANGYRNYVLSNTWRYMTEDGTQYGGTHTDVEAFYQVPKGGILSGGHQGYLPVLIPESGNAPSFTFLFMGDETTAIDETIANFGEVNGENATYFNLNGQKMNGVPTQRGIYIVNGKKVSIK